MAEGLRPGLYRWEFNSGLPPPAGYLTSPIEFEVRIQPPAGCTVRGGSGETAPWSIATLLLLAGLLRVCRMRRGPDAGAT